MSSVYSGTLSRTHLALPIEGRDHIQGPFNAPRALIEYGDYECPFCGQAFLMLKEVREEMGDRLCFAYRNFPLINVHPHSEQAAESAEAAGARGRFWEMHDLLFENQDALEIENIAQYAQMTGLDPAEIVEDVRNGTFTPRVREDFRAGMRAGVNGTPTFFINGERYEGAFSAASMIRALTQLDY